MIEDVGQAIGAFENILEEVKRTDLSFSEAAGLWAATRFLATDFHEYADRELKGHNYVKEKARKFRWHIGAALNFEITNGHDKAQHIRWAHGQLDSLAATIAGR